ncbi:MAG: hypothetical protein WCK35_07485 [Chloroflexota bacterium]
MAKQDIPEAEDEVKGVAMIYDVGVAYGKRKVLTKELLASRMVR